MNLEHAKEYIKTQLGSLSKIMIGNDANHITMLYFVVSSAKLLKLEIDWNIVTGWVLKH